MLAPQETPYFPVFVDLRQGSVLVVGGGAVASRKVDALLAADARITVGSPELCDHLQSLQLAGRIRWIRGQYEPTWLRHRGLVIAATDDREVNARVAADARAQSVWVNVVDEPEVSNVILPAVVRRGPLTVAIGTQGFAPSLSRRLREELEKLLSPSLGGLLELAARYRARIKSIVPLGKERRDFYDWLLDGPVFAALRAERTQQAEQLLQQALSDPTVPQQTDGEVLIVGAGPGDPDLLTVRALRALQRADVILHDRLIGPDVLGLARRDAETIAVGKEGGGVSVSQESINERLVSLARAGKRVVRLKGGDPFVFGRGGEEAEYLAAQGIRFEIVPGISAALGCAAYAGVPLTHRDHAQALEFVTAHGAQQDGALDWPSLAQANKTAVFYMAIQKAQETKRNLIAAGRASSTPIAIIENGTMAEQRVIRATLGQLADAVRQYRVQSPALVIVGEVVAVSERISWFGQAPIQMPAPLATAAEAASAEVPSYSY
ncbi:MAG: uroporphyrinogen-III C-methyltransferase [Ahniella sp.]|nr:uroporphyrinogen-III C-methyltransferase [Ahniella sp.]